MTSDALPDVVGDLADAAAQAALARAAAGQLLGPTDIMAIWHIGRTQFWRLNQARAFDVFKTKPAIGPRCFSGVLVYRYLTGQPLYEPTFGRQRRA